MDDNDRCDEPYREQKDAATEDSNGRHPALSQTLAHAHGTIADIVNARSTADAQKDANRREQNTGKEGPKMKGWEPTD